METEASSLLALPCTPRTPPHSSHSPALAYTIPHYPHSSHSPAIPYNPIPHYPHFSHSAALRYPTRYAAALPYPATSLVLALLLQLHFAGVHRRGRGRLRRGAPTARNDGFFADALGLVLHMEQHLPNDS